MRSWRRFGGSAARIRFHRLATDWPSPSTWEAEGVPPGGYTIHASFELDGVPYGASADARAGEHAVLRLAPSE